MFMEMFPFFVICGKLSQASGKAKQKNVDISNCLDISAFCDHTLEMCDHKI